MGSSEVPWLDEKVGPRWVDPWPVYFLRLAQNVATRSKHPRSQQGAVLVAPTPPYFIRATGYNGPPVGFPDDKVNWAPGMTWTDRDWTIHAEENALLQAGEERARGCHLYVTAPPCPRCYLRAVHCGITAICYGGASYSAADADRKLLNHLVELARVPLYRLNEQNNLVTG